MDTTPETFDSLLTVFVRRIERQPQARQQAARVRADRHAGRADRPAVGRRSAGCRPSARCPGSRSGPAARGCWSRTSPAACSGLRGRAPAPRSGWRRRTRPPARRARSAAAAGWSPAKLKVGRRSISGNDSRSEAAAYTRGAACAATGAATARMVSSAAVRAARRSRWRGVMLLLRSGSSRSAGSVSSSRPPGSRKVAACSPLVVAVRAGELGESGEVARVGGQQPRQQRAGPGSAAFVTPSM